MEVRRATNDFAPGQSADFYLKQVVVLKEAIEDLNDVLGPVLRRPT